ncbi:Glyoxalase/bleomycin resistance protein/dioxygenase [Euzebya pacifica]|uniref:Glyoxalase/bleomycin resistance protein/dioxygenase n=1 Tax=Euzebya pacifica TaxID=1608957 RepID=A0A346XSR1_9ACTN|nr:VOC family protein [Euzebya pacifica]AXV05258.1 Glyoxalase/bleomycin resistance protein/dioxygenase [Euzebya pacifica]
MDEPAFPDPPAVLPSTLELGAFSMSLSVADLDVSRRFYEALGFVVSGGDADEGWVILKNGESTIGLFHGMFEGSILTFNPGLTNGMAKLESFTDVRVIQQRLEEAGLELSTTPEGEEGPASLTLTDPDGNNILIDQFFRS